MIITKKNRILGIHSGKRSDPGPCELYRITTPLHYLNKRPGWSCQWLSFIQFYEDYLKTNAEEGLKFIADHYDMVIWARTYLKPTEEGFASAAYTVQRLRQLGVHQIYEVDDDYTNEHRFVAMGDAVNFASWCDAITVTTPLLAETMRRKTNRPVHILPNMLDPELWQIPSQIKMDDNYLRIVLSGSTTHKEDWRPLGGVLQQIAADYPNVRFLIGGYHPDYLKDIPNAEYIPPIPYHLYIDLIKAADIILCPVAPYDKFNLGKSPIKATEGQGATRDLFGEPAGAAIIATDNPVYRIAVPNSDFGVLVEHSSGAWDKAIRELIDDTERRHRLQRAGYKFVWKNFNLETGWLRWATAYQRILSKPVNPTKINYGQALTTYRESASMPNGITA